MELFDITRTVGHGSSIAGARADDKGYKNAYVAVFQACAKGIIKGAAEQEFDSTKSILQN